MKIAYVVFNGITLLDFIGIYDPFTRLRSLKFMPDLTWDVCAFTETVSDSFGLQVRPDKIKNDLGGYDVLVVPGGFGTRELVSDQEFLSWLMQAKSVECKLSVCTGSLLLGAAGFLRDKRATTNFAEYETLKKYCREVVTDRIVDEGTVVTAGAVSASIDLGLYMCKKWSGEQAEAEIRQRMDYHG